MTRSQSNAEEGTEDHPDPVVQTQVQLVAEHGQVAKC